jgi:hypothetical protein
MNNLRLISRSIIQSKNYFYYKCLIQKNINSDLTKNSRIALLKSVNFNQYHTSNILLYTAQEKEARNMIKKYTKKSQLKPVIVRQNMTIRELADAMNRPTQHVFDCLRQMNLGSIVRNNRDSTIIPNLDITIKIIKMSGFRYQMPGPVEIDYDLLEAELDSQDDSLTKRPRPDPKSLFRRHPVVTIMGHVI